MLETTTNLVAQLKAFYKIGHEYTSHISLITLTYIECLYKELE